MIRTTIHGIRLASISLGCYWLLLFCATHLPRVPMPHFSHSDKFIHFGAFAGLAILMAWAIPTFADKRWLNVIAAFGATVIYGAIDEITQAPVGRTPDILDWSADTLGATFGILVYVWLRRLIVTHGRSRLASQPMTLEAPPA